MTLTVTNPPATFYYGYTFGGSAVASASARLATDPNTGIASGYLEMTLLSPGLMGSGTYHDTVQMEVCTDSQCANQIQGSPVTINVTYTVTGNSVSNAGYDIVPTSLYFEAPTNGSVATQTIAVTAEDLPPYGAYVSLSSQSGGPVSNLSFVQTTANAEPYAYATGTLTVTMKPPASLGPGTYTDTVSLSICYDQACTKQAPQSPLLIPVTYLVTASAGQEFTQLTVSQNVSTLAVNPIGTLLYATTVPCSLASGCSTAPQLISIDPISGTVTTLISNLAAPVSQLLVSQDGAYLYLVANATVSRVNTANWMIDQTVQLTPNSFASSGIALSPVSSTTWAASYSPVPTGSTATSEVQIFDGSTARPDVLTQPNSSDIGLGVVWSADGSTVYVTDPVFNLSKVPVTASGLGPPISMQTSATFYAVGLQLASGLLYAENGQVLNPANNALVGQYPLPTGTPYAGFTVDPANNRVFAGFNQSMSNGVVATLESYNLSTFSPLWVARVPGGGAPVRWGAQGLAWIGPGATQAVAQVYIISGVFVAP